MQVKHAFPGLISECRKLIKYYILEDIIDGNVVLSKQVWKKRVKNAVRIKSEELLKKEFNNYSKLKNLDSPKEELKVKYYVKDMTIRNARTMFKIRSHMTDVKFNQKSNKKFANELWKCDFCASLDSQSHIIWCPAFASLREGRTFRMTMTWSATFNQ